MIFTGVAEDPRSEIEKTKDWKHEEIFGMGAYVWTTKTPPQYTKRNQNGSFECGGFATAKALGINNLRETGKYVDLNPNFIYQLRANKPGDGMFMQNMFDIACKYGAPIDPELSSDNKTQQELDTVTFPDGLFNTALSFRGKNYVFIDKTNIDGIAQAIDNGYTPIFLLKAGLKEWTTEPIADPSTTVFELVHYVPAICATLRNGQKAIVVDDSWGSSYGANGQRFLSEDFILNRVLQVGYIVDLPTQPSWQIHHTFVTPLIYGMTNNADVRALQDILRYEGFLSVPSTGNFYSLTAKALKAWQVKHGIMDFVNEQDLTKIRAGVKTISKLNELYGN